MALTVLAIGCRGPAPASCPGDPPLTVDLEAWREAIESQRLRPNGEPDYDTQLARLGLPPVEAAGGDGRSPEAGAMTLVKLQVVPLRRGGGRPLDWLVAARFRGADGAEALRVQLLRPLTGREHVWCPLGDDLSHDKAVFEDPCIETHEGPARVLAIEQLVAPDRDAVVARDAGGWCGPGAERGDRFATSYWGVEQDRLVRYLEAVTFEAWYESPAPPVETRRGEIELSATWPREITFTETIECRPADEIPPAAADCEPGERTMRYRYADDRYTLIAVSSPTAAETTGRTAEEPRS